MLTIAADMVSLVLAKSFVLYLSWGPGVHCEILCPQQIAVLSDFFTKWSVFLFSFEPQPLPSGELDP
jgi:hypothetical protein